ncbi:MAG: chemotaxis protein CheR [Alphaproteobacteria bacterium]|nr:chemotaxis protein CheR [Alphaproteobacteria bacterium]
MRAEAEWGFMITDRLQQISDQEANALIDIIYEKSGIVLSVARKSLVLARLGRRLRQIGVGSFAEYIDIIRSGQDVEELSCMIDEITTNKTEFFREAHHFQFLAQKLLPEWSQRAAGSVISLSAYCLGCSTGEEPYSLAMTLAEHFRTTPGMFSVTGLDICRRTISNARRAVYKEENVQTVPPEYRKYLMIGKGVQKGNYRVVPEIRGRVNFQHANITEPSFQIPDAPNLVFSRNVMIYFDRKTIAGIVKKVENALAPGGHFFIGHSETLNGLDHSFISVAPTVYMKPAA